MLNRKQIYVSSVILFLYSEHAAFILRSMHFKFQNLEKFLKQSKKKINLFGKFISVFTVTLNSPAKDA